MVPAVPNRTPAEPALREPLLLLEERPRRTPGSNLLAMIAPWWAFILCATGAGATAGFFFDEPSIHGFRFAFSFALISTVAAVLWATRSRVVGFDLVRRVLLFIAFPLTGLAFSTLLGARYETGYRVSTISFYEVMVPLAVGIFTFLFCTMVNGVMGHIRDLIPYSVVLALILIIETSLLPDRAQEHALTATAFYLVSYCCGLLALLLLVSFFLADSFNNILPNLLLLMAVNITLPLSIAGKAALAVICGSHLVISNVLFGSRLLRAFRNRKAAPPKFTPRFDGALARSFFATPLLANMSVFATLGAIIPYVGFIQYLRQKNYFVKQNVIIGLVLGMAATIVYTSSFLFFDSVFPAIFDSDFSGEVPTRFILLHVGFLSALACFSSSVLAWCFSYHEKYFGRPGHRPSAEPTT